MDFEEVFPVLDGVVFTKVQRHIKDVEKFVLWGTWEGKTYEEMALASNYSYTPSYIKQYVGPKLWKFLSEVFEENISKTNVRVVIEQQWHCFLHEFECFRLQKVASYQELTLSAQETQAQKITSETPALMSSEIETINQDQDWGEAADVSIFYGRTEELKTLQQWIMQDNCRLVAILGMGGIGKTTLSIKLAQQIQDKFEFVIWCSLQNAPPVEKILTQLIQFFSHQQEVNLPETIEAKVLQLLNYIRSSRCLVLLDNFDSIFDSGSYAGCYRQEYEGYSYLLKVIGETYHQSCFILTSREKPAEVALFEGVNLLVRSLQLGGLAPAEAEKILADKGCSRFSNEDWQEVYEYYAGNPLALKIFASTVQELAGDNLTQLQSYLKQGQLKLQEVKDLLAKQLNRLTAIEQQIIQRLAKNQAPVSLYQLEVEVLPEKSTEQLLLALQSLQRRGLIEQSGNQLLLSQMVMEYATPIETITEQETFERYRLELRVERSFYEAGIALKELRDRCLYKLTHNTFEAYCRDRFNYSRDAAYLKIAAAEVYDNIQKFLPTICRQKFLMPTNEYQLRALAKANLTPEIQAYIWIQGVEKAGGKNPSGRIIKEIVLEQLKTSRPTTIVVPYSEGDVVEISAKDSSKLCKYKGYWGIITRIVNDGCIVHIKSRRLDVQCCLDEIKKVDEAQKVQLLAIGERIQALRLLSIQSPSALAVLKILAEQAVFHPDDLWLLAQLEERYGSLSGSVAKIAASLVGYSL